MKKNNQKSLDNICFITYIDRVDDSENYKIVFYKKCDGSCPIKEFLDSLDEKMRKSDSKSNEENDKAIA